MDVITLCLTRQVATGVNLPLRGSRGNPSAAHTIQPIPSILLGPSTQWAIGASIGREHRRLVQLIQVCQRATLECRDDTRHRQVGLVRLRYQRLIIGGRDLLDLGFLRCTR